MEYMSHRVLLVSDMHYTTQLSPAQMRRIDPAIRVSAAAGDAFGYTQKEKIDCLLEDLRREKNVEAVFVLGDLSLDDYDSRNLPDNYCRKLKEECMDRLPCPAYAIPGNHDSYPNGIWKEIFGHDRQFSVKLDDTAFILLDTFARVPAEGAAGAAFTDVDVEFLKGELVKYPTEKIFLCAHHFSRKGTGALEKILEENDRIVCLFRGHTHFNEVISQEAFRGRSLVDIGGYGYNGECVDGKWVFDRFDPAWAWGYQVLEWSDTKLRTYHIKPARIYRAANGLFSFPETVEDLLEFPK